MHIGKNYALVHLYVSHQVNQNYLVRQVVRSISSLFTLMKKIEYAEVSSVMLFGA